MIDLKFLRENPDVVKENIKKKFQDEKLVTWLNKCKKQLIT
jgi:seryl-tRNA synthetase